MSAPTFSEEINGNEVALIATMILAPKKVKDGDSELPRAVFRVDQVLKGGEHLVTEKKGVYAPIHLLYFGDKHPGSQFLLTGPILKRGYPISLTKRSVEYILKLLKLPEEGLDRLVFFQKYLEDEDAILARDAFDEFANAPYSDFQALKSRMNRKLVLKWLADEKVPRRRKSMYFMMLSVCGKTEDVQMLAGMLAAKPDDNEPRIGLQPIMASYVMLAGVDGMHLIDELFMAKKNVPYTDLYAAVMALRFMEEQKVISKKRLLKSARYVLDRPEYADLVIPDLARWEDWSVMDRLIKLFKSSDQESAWVRAPVIQYLMACPLPKAKKYIAELKKIDPESVKRASFILSRGLPAPTPAPEAENPIRSTGSSSTTGAIRFQSVNSRLSRHPSRRR